jgi:uncharacterized membrane protein YidH (DUF202 family)
MEHSSEAFKKIKPLKQKTKDRLTVIAILAIEIILILDAINNFYQYAHLKAVYYLIHAILSTIGVVVFLVIIILLLIAYLDKRKVLMSFKK